MASITKTVVHGMWGTPEYIAWRGMLNRCYLPTKAAYKWYGGRGIEVCEEWRNSFQSFIDAVGKRPSPKHSLDRLDSDKNYTPDNVHWATRHQQAINRKMQSNNKSGYRGVSWHKQRQRYTARIHNGYYMSLGLFDKSDQAALAYDVAAIQIDGAEAKTNLI